MNTTAKLNPMQIQYAWSTVRPVLRETHFTAGEWRIGSDSSPAFSLSFPSPVTCDASWPARAEGGLLVGLEDFCARTEIGENVTTTKNSNATNRAARDGRMREVIG